MLCQQTIYSTCTANMRLCLVNGLVAYIRNLTNNVHNHLHKTKRNTSLSTKPFLSIQFVYPKNNVTHHSHFHEIPTLNKHPFFLDKETNTDTSPRKNGTKKTSPKAHHLSLARGGVGHVEAEALRDRKMLLPRVTWRSQLLDTSVSAGDPWMEHGVYFTEPWIVARCFVVGGFNPIGKKLVKLETFPK